MEIKKVPVEDKIFFLRWLLNKHDLKEKEFTNYFVYLINNPHLLEKVHFTYETKRFTQTLILSTKNIIGSGVIYRYKNSVHFDKDTTFKYINHYSNDCDLFIKIDYPESLFCDLYASVLIDDLSEPSLSNTDIQEIEQFLNYNVLLLKKQFLLSELDKFLDLGDKESFCEFSKELKLVNDEIENAFSKI